MHELTLDLSQKKQVDIRIYSKNSTVFCVGDDGLYYSIPHYCFVSTLFKLPNAPIILTIYSSKPIEKYEILSFDKLRRS
jgi:hypothetical protein